MRTLWRLVGNVYGSMSEGRMGEAYDVLKEEYDKLTPYEQINIKRSIINMAVFATTIL